MHTSKPKEMIIGVIIISIAQGHATKIGDVAKRLNNLAQCKYVLMTGVERQYCKGDSNRAWSMHEAILVQIDNILIVI